MQRTDAGLPGRGQQHLRQLLLPQPRRRQVRRGVGRAERGELLALGRERRRPQRRRLGGRLHHRQHELPLPLRRQLAAAQRPGQELPATASSSSASSRGAAAAPARPGSTSTARARTRTTRTARARRGRSRSWAPWAPAPSAIFDLDGDGDLDIVTNDFNSEPQVLISDLAAEGARSTG